MKRENAVQFAEKTRETIQREVKSVGDKGTGVSIGMAEFNDEDDNELDSLIKRANDNLNRAKEGGRNRVVS